MRLVRRICDYDVSGDTVPLGRVGLCTVAFPIKSFDGTFRVLE